MTRFHLAMYFDQESGVVPTDVRRISAVVGELNNELRDRGAWVMAAGFEPSPRAHVVTADDEGADTADGPYLHTGEQAGGFWIIDAPTMGDAIVWAERASRMLHLPVEVRALAA